MEIRAEQQAFIEAVERGFYASCHGDQELKDNIQKTSIRAFIANENKEVIEELAKNILEAFPQLNPSTSSKRYKFAKLSNRDSLLHAIFKRSFETTPDDLVGAAEKTEPERGPYYSRWKKIFVINLYKGVAIATGHPFFRIPLAVAELVLLYRVLAVFYGVTSEWINARVIPFFINSTPIQVIKAGNWIFDTKDWIIRSGNILLIALIVRVVRRTFVSPMTIGWFLLITSVQGTLFFYDTAKKISLFFDERFQAVENERLYVCQKKTFALWKKVIAH